MAAEAVEPKKIAVPLNLETHHLYKVVHGLSDQLWVSSMSRSSNILCKHTLSDSNRTCVPTSFSLTTVMD